MTNKEENGEYRKKMGQKEMTDARRLGHERENQEQRYKEDSLQHKQSTL